MKKLFLICALFLSIASFASHNMAGEITYKHVSGYTYEITVTTYTKESSALADKCSLTVNFGDSQTGIFNRVNGPKSPNVCSGTIPMGESIGNNIKKNIYKEQHTYPGPNTFNITMEDPNRNSKICNLGANSDQLSFFLKTVLVINPFLSPNNSPEFLNPPIDNGCVGQCYTHNPAIYDVDGDSLSYKLVPCLANGQPIPTFSFPTGVTEESINHTTGTFEWCAPTENCSYNIAILVEEWKHLGDKWYFTGSVLRDLQITTEACNNNAPKVYKIFAGTDFAEVGNPFFYETSADDADGQTIQLTALGGPLLANPAATFTSSSSPSHIIGEFHWTPGCDAVQYVPHQVTFKVEDNDNIKKLTDYEALRILVIAPAVTNVNTHPFLNSVWLKWDPTSCNQTTGKNPLVGYSIYRKSGCDTWTHKFGEVGVPASAGYELIGSTDSTETHYEDYNLAIGIDYTYIIVCRYLDGAQSYASDAKCIRVTSISELNNDVEIKIYPNPSDGTFQVQSEFYSHSSVTISVKNCLGQLLYEKNTILSNTGESVSVNAEPGIYFLEIANHSGRTVKKISIH